MLGQRLSGKEVSVKAKLEKKAGEKWLTVTDYRDLNYKPAKQPAKN
jgi:hypothetical protein